MFSTQIPCVSWCAVIVLLKRSTYTIYIYISHISVRSHKHPANIPDANPTNKGLENGWLTWEISPSSLSSSLNIMTRLRKITSHQTCLQTRDWAMWICMRQWKCPKNRPTKRESCHVRWIIHRGFSTHIHYAWNDIGSLNACCGRRQRCVSLDWIEIGCMKWVYVVVEWTFRMDFRHQACHLYSAETKPHLYMVFAGAYNSLAFRFFFCGTYV